MQTTKQTIELEVPVGYRPSPGKQPRKAAQNEFVLRFGRAEKYVGWNEDVFIILEPDPSYIDTTTEEYQVEVYRQSRRNRRTQFRPIDGVSWGRHGSCCWDWSRSVYRVEPEGTDELGPYYTDEGRKVYVPR